MSMTAKCAQCKGPLELTDATVEELEEEFGHIPRKLKHVTCPVDEPDTVPYVIEVRIYGGPDAPEGLDPFASAANGDALLSAFRVAAESETFEDALPKLAKALEPHWAQLQKNAELLDAAIQDEPVAVETAHGG